MSTTDDLRAGRTVVAAEVADAALLDHALRLGTPALVVPATLVSTVQLHGRTPLLRAAAPGIDAHVVDLADIENVTSQQGLLAAVARGVRVVSIDVAAVVDAALDRFEMPSAGSGFAFDATGGREPVVLLSGMLGDASGWDAVATGVADLLAPWPLRIDLDDSVPELAQSVLAQAPPRFVLCGHSLGGIVALEVMRRAPERVSGLVLVAASARGPNDAQQAAWTSWRERTENGAFGDVARELAVATVAADRRDDERLVDANARMADAVGPDGFLRQLDAQSTRPDSIESLGAITVPVLVISGSADAICPPHLQQELVDNLTEGELVSVPGSGHMVALEQPDAVVTAIRDWYETRLTPGATGDPAR